MRHIKYSALFFFLILSTSCFDGITEPHSLKFDKTFDLLAKDINSQKEIFEMNDLTRHYGRLNGFLIHAIAKPKVENSSTLINTEEGFKPLNQILDSFNINRDLFENFRHRLEETRLREFYKSNDSILFIVDGFLSDSWGFIYSTKQLRSTAVDFDFGEFSVTLLDSINENWRKVAIR